MDSRLLERLALALFPHLRIWDGWKIRIPINTVGLFSATQKWAAQKSESYSMEVGHITKAKVNLTLIAEPAFRFERALLAGFDGSAKDGEVAVLAPVTWVTSPLLRTLGDRPLPDILVLPQKVSDRSLAWFVWSRERHGSWKFIELEED